MKRKLKNFLSLTLISSVLLGSSVTISAAPVMMADGTFFDAEYYAQTNPDVVGVLGTDTTALYNHYVNNGKAEGRAPYNPAIDISSLVDTATYAASIDATLRDTDSSYLELKTALPGSYITFGTYEQDNNKKNGQEPIEWLVLENDGESLFVLSKYVLDGQLYSNAYSEHAWNTLPITWEQCYLRSWLNNTFLATAFTAGEQARINTTFVDNSLPKDFHAFPDEEPVTGGNHTFDKVYVLSYDEVIKYFPMKDIWYSSFGSPVNYDKLLQATATPYAIKQGVDIWSAKDAATCLSYGGGYKNIANDVIGYVEKWALRTPYGSQTCIYNVGASGSFGYRQATYDNATRPCMRISIK
ncbi:MAG: hypothetical protein IJO85_06000 [Lachnospiraceae bacterium]|nr:hypothetical protein [Lachnospiraceae bacterium]